MRDQDRFRGCLIGGAAGDALGYTVEFLRQGQIFRLYGEHGITEYDLTGGVAQMLIMIRFPLLNRRHTKRRIGRRYLISRRSRTAGHDAVTGYRQRCGNCGKT